MIRKFGRVLAFATLGFALIGSTTLIQPALADGGGAKAPRLEGLLASVSSPSVTIRLQNVAMRTLTIVATTKIERNGRTASLAAFKSGDRVQARFTASGSSVVKFEGVGS